MNEYEEIRDNRHLNTQHGVWHQTGIESSFVLFFCYLNILLLFLQNNSPFLHRFKASSFLNISEKETNQKKKNRKISEATSVVFFIPNWKDSFISPLFISSDHLWKGTVIRFLTSFLFTLSLSLFFLFCFPFSSFLSTDFLSMFPLLLFSFFFFSVDSFVPLFFLLVFLLSFCFHFSLSLSFCVYVPFF